MANEVETRSGFGVFLLVVLVALQVLIITASDFMSDLVKIIAILAAV